MNKSLLNRYFNSATSTAKKMSTGDIIMYVALAIALGLIIAGIVFVFRKDCYTKKRSMIVKSIKQSDKKYTIEVVSQGINLSSNPAAEFTATVDTKGTTYAVGGAIDIYTDECKTSTDFKLSKDHNKMIGWILLGAGAVAAAAGIITKMMMEDKPSVSTPSA